MELFSIIIVAVMTVFAVLGILDNVFFKNKYGLGEEFMKGMEMIGPLCVAIVGIIALVPVIAWIIERTLTPLYRSLGLDPSLAVTTILAIDMGGFQLARSVALDPVIGDWAGIVYGSMMGATIVFSIPVGLAAIQKKNVSVFSKGVLYGIAAIPIGTFVGGLIMGIEPGIMMKNLIIPVLISTIIIYCLARHQEGTIRVFTGFSAFVNVVAMIGLALAMINDLILIPLANTGAFDISTIPFFRLLGSTSEGIGVAGAIGLVLSGALPFVKCLNKWLEKPLKDLGKKIGMSEAGITGFLLSAANNMAMFATFDNMQEKEQILNVAFAVCASFVIGDHLAFTAANAPECIVPMMVAKLVSGIVAVLVAAVFYKPTEK